MSHPEDDAEYSDYWLGAEQSARADAAENIGVTIFPKHHLQLELRLLVDPRFIKADVDGQFTVTLGIVVLYRWTGGEEGLTKATAMLTRVGSPDLPDGWRFNLPRLMSGKILNFQVKRRRFADRYT